MPYEVIDYMDQYVLSDKFGWTPGQINDLDIKDKQAYLIILGAINRVEEKESKKMEKMNKNGRPNR